MEALAGQGRRGGDLPEQNINIALGTDYTGEEKKGFLRQAMYRADGMGMLGLHAGTKVVIVKDARSGQHQRHGCFLFGLTATGKSTWSCHQLGLDHDEGDLKRWSLRSFYSEAEIETYLQEIAAGRLEHTAGIAAQGLRPEIVRMAERACEEITPRRKQAAIPREVTAPPEIPLPPALDEARAPGPSVAPESRSAWISGWEPRRPPRPMGRWK